MTRTRAIVGVLGLVLVAVLAVVWLLPTVYGASVECRDINAVACDRVWRAAAARADAPHFGPMTKVVVIGPEECPYVSLDWVGGGWFSQSDCAT